MLFCPSETLHRKTGAAAPWCAMSQVQSDPHPGISFFFSDYSRPVSFDKTHFLMRKDCGAYLYTSTSDTGTYMTQNAIIMRVKSSGVVMWLICPA